MKVKNLEKWERKSHYEWFSSFANPSLSFDVKMNITKVLSFCKKRDISSFAVIMYVICDCINKNKAMRLRILNSQVVEIERANIAYTAMPKDSTMQEESCFVNCRVSTKNGFDAYLDELKNNKEKYNVCNYIQDKFNNTAVIDDIYCSCIPWLNFMSVKQPIPDESPENKSIPRACWGKYYKEGNSVFMTLNITANHALINGMDLSNVFNDIQNTFDNIYTYFSEV